MNNTLLTVGITALFFFIVAGAVITDLTRHNKRLHEMKEFWYQKYCDEHQVLERYRAALRKGEFNA